MFTWMRTHQRTLMVVITFLTIISFVWLYSAHDPTQMQRDEVARMYDRNISSNDFQRAMRKFHLALSLGLVEYASLLSGGSEQGAVEFAVNTIIIEHEGGRLGLHPSDEQVAAAIMGIPAFQTGGKFDAAKYESIYQRDFAPNGFTRAEIDEIVRNSMMFDRIRATIDTVPVVTEADIAYFSRAFQPVSGAAIVFKTAEFAKSVAPTDAQIADYLKSNAAQFRTPEWRTARVVRFQLPAGADKLEGKAKIEAQQKVATASDEFSQQAVAIGFEKAAQAAGLKVETTLPFDRSGAVKTTPGVAPSADLSAPVQALAPAIFTLTPKTPVSRVIESGNEFLVAELVDITDSKEMTLEEARPLIVQTLTDSAARAALQKGVDEALASIRASLQSGKSFAEAAAAAGVQTTPFSNISLADESAPQEQLRYADAALVANENEISGFRPDMEGGYAVWVEKRAPIDQKTFGEQKKEMQDAILSQRQTVLFRDWLNTAAKDSGLTFANSDEQD